MPIAASDRPAVDLAHARVRGRQDRREDNHDPDALADALAKLEQGARARPMQVNPAAAHMFIVNPLAGLQGR